MGDCGLARRRVAGSGRGGGRRHERKGQIGSMVSALRVAARSGAATRSPPQARHAAWPCRLSSCRAVRAYGSRPSAAHARQVASCALAQLRRRSRYHPHRKMRTWMLVKQLTTMSRLTTMWRLITMWRLARPRSQCRLSRRRVRRLRGLPTRGCAAWRSQSSQFRSNFHVDVGRARRRPGFLGEVRIEGRWLTSLSQLWLT